MYSKLDRSHRALSVFLGVLTIASVGVLLIWDALPGVFPPHTHDYVAAFSLAMIAIAYLVFMAAERPPWREMVKALALAFAFLFWAANQLWPNLPQATLFNDLAIALFVLDIFLVIVGWPRARQDGVSKLGGMVPEEPRLIAGATRDAGDEVVALEGKEPRFVDTGGIEMGGIQTRGIERKGKFVMLCLLLVVAAGLAGLKYMRLKAKS